MIRHMKNELRIFTDKLKKRNNKKREQKLVYKQHNFFFLKSKA